MRVEFQPPPLFGRLLFIRPPPSCQVPPPQVYAEPRRRGVRVCQVGPAVHEDCGGPVAIPLALAPAASRALVTLPADPPHCLAMCPIPTGPALHTLSKLCCQHRFHFRNHKDSKFCAKYVDPAKCAELGPRTNTEAAESVTPLPECRASRSALPLAPHDISGVRMAGALQAHLSAYERGAIRLHHPAPPRAAQPRPDAPQAGAALERVAPWLGVRGGSLAVNRFERKKPTLVHYLREKIVLLKTPFISTAPPRTFPAKWEAPSILATILNVSVFSAAALYETALSAVHLTICHAFNLSLSLSCSTRPRPPPARS